MKQKSRYLLAFTAVLALMFVTIAPVCASEADDKIESSFKESYVCRTYLKDDAIKAVAKDGVVTLTGTVANDSHKALAQELASGLSGVDSVDNQLATTAEAAAEKADTWIGRKVKLALMFHRNVNGGKTDIAVKDGVVTLKGEASSAAQKELTTEYAKDIEGVKELKNEMTVAADVQPAERTLSEKIDDASITAQVKTALQTHRSTSSVQTRVQTRDGVVSLTGIARNAAEKSLVTKLVNDIQGVTTVKNEMTVEESVTR